MPTSIGGYAAAAVDLITIMIPDDDEWSLLLAASGLGIMLGPSSILRPAYAELWDRGLVVRIGDDDGYVMYRVVDGVVDGGDGDGEHLL